MLAHRCQSEPGNQAQPSPKRPSAYFHEGGCQAYLGGESRPGAHTAWGRAACQETGCPAGAAATEYEYQSGPRDDCEHLGRRSRRPRAVHRDGGGQLDHHGVSEPSGDAERPEHAPGGNEPLANASCNWSGGPPVPSTHAWGTRHGH